ncbi:hypothetical protein HOD88_00275 [archaeon]|nr:hypothetical protein [archaeon]
MNKILLTFLLLSFVFGISIHSNLISAEDDDFEENESENEFEEEEDSEDFDEEEDFDENKDKSKTKEKTSTQFEGYVMEEEKEIEFENGKQKIEIQRRIRYENGTEITYKIKIEEKEKNGEIIQKISVEGKGPEVESKLKLKTINQGNESIIRAMLSNGNETTINFLPDEIYSRIREQLHTQNISIELEEKVHKNIPKVIYNIEANKNGKFLGIFKMKLKIEEEIDAETGELLKMNTPWWAFMVSEDEEESETETENETLINQTNNS